MLNLSNIHIAISNKWGSVCEYNRFNIRQNILELLNGLKIKFDKRLLLDTSLRPIIKKCSISISHSRQLGGYILSLDGETSVGFDIEQSSRITKKVVDRIDTSCNASMKSKVPDLIWVAKEASFKAMSNAGKKTLLKNLFIKIGHIKNNILYYEFNDVGQGVAFRYNGHAISISRGFKVLINSLVNS